MKTDSAYIRQIIVSGDYEYIEDIESVKIPSSEPAPTFSNIDWHPSINPQALNIIAGVILACLLGMVIWRFVSRPRSKKDDSDSPISPDTIHGHDWDKEIKECMSRQDYSETVVLCYLRWLDILNTDGVIDFHESKTPEIFIEEVRAYANADTAGDPNPDHTQNTRILTSHYLAIRYGHRRVDVSCAKQALGIINFDYKP